MFDVERTTGVLRSAFASDRYRAALVHDLPQPLDWTGLASQRKPSQPWGVLPGLSRWDQTLCAGGAPVAPGGPAPRHPQPERVFSGLVPLWPPPVALCGPPFCDDKVEPRPVDKRLVQTASDLGDRGARLV